MFITTSKYSPRLREGSSLSLHCELLFVCVEPYSPPSLQYVSFSQLVCFILPFGPKLSELIQMALRSQVYILRSRVAGWFRSL